LEENLGIKILLERRQKVEVKLEQVENVPS